MVKIESLWVRVSFTICQRNWVNSFHLRLIKFIFLFGHFGSALWTNKKNDPEFQPIETVCLSTQNYSEDHIIQIDTSLHRIKHKTTQCRDGDKVKPTTTSLISVTPTIQNMEGTLANTPEPELGQT
ncbi:uncharacterized protein LOC125670081 [Ostrea edulis]|uniref:uncharacterized protein LOC125670081 n=1 Tax=Ostrea edulis TaxID=37623 RepID=UPI0024AF3A6F|nr:uncharacterized protein LOC125670081 [Ostrea edulis]